MESRVQIEMNAIIIMEDVNIFATMLLVLIVALVS
jgi:hypothetical protein